MPAILQNILNKIKDWWKNFSMRQKVIIVVMTVVVIALIGKSKKETGCRICNKHTFLFRTSGNNSYLG